MYRNGKFIAAFLTTAAIVSAASTGEQIPAKIDNPRSVVVSERSVVDVYASQFQDTLIALPPSEKVRQVFVGDSANWLLTTGKTDEPTRYISIKVKEPIVKHTTVNVLSDHDKSYTFRLILSPDHCDSKVFIDADQELAQDLAKPAAWVAAAKLDEVKKESEKVKADAQQSAQAAITKAETESESFRAKYPASLHFDYIWDQKVGEKLGVIQIFRDDKFTYIAAQPQETPTFYEVKDKKPSLVNFDYAKGLYTIPKHVSEGYLAIGKQKMDFREVVSN